jgi:hypothetical protein
MAVVLLNQQRERIRRAASAITVIRPGFILGVSQGLSSWKLSVHGERLDWVWR